VAALAAGIDAASMARRCQEPSQKTANVFLHQLTRWRGRVGRGSDRRRARRDAGGSPRSALDDVERDPTASARGQSKPRNPLNPAVQAGFRRTASRRAEPLPTLSHAQRRPARSDNGNNGNNGDNSNNSGNTGNTGNTGVNGTAGTPAPPLSALSDKAASPPPAEHSGTTLAASRPQPACRAPHGSAS
jgi:hypothetical protein